MVDNNLQKDIADAVLNTESAEDNLGKLKTNGEMCKEKNRKTCFFCESYDLNVSSHIQRNHAKEVEVQRIYALSTKYKERWGHRKTCNASKSQTEAQNLLLRNLRTDPRLMETVFPTMRADEVSLVVKKDEGMRELSKMLIQVRKIDSTVKCLFDALKPKHFDSLINATKTLAKFDSENDILYRLHLL